MRIDPDKFELMRKEHLKARAVYEEASNVFKAAEEGLQAARDRVWKTGQQLRDYWHECADLKPGEPFV